MTNDCDLLYRDREAWSDVTPIPQDDGPNPVVPIDYPSDFEDTMDYFRGIMATNEKSERVLELLSSVIQLNPANYTVWHYRRLVLEALDSNLEKETEFLDEISTENAKNYQLWYHRRWVAGRRGAPAGIGELDLTASVFSLDAKNYHAWSHRQWVLRELGGWENELQFCEKLLNEDIRNNSAWNQRFFVITQSPLLGDLSVQRPSEVQFCVKAIHKVPSNESPWRYLRGLYERKWDLIVKDENVLSLCRDIIRLHPECVHAMALLLDLFLWGLKPQPSDFNLLNMDKTSSSKYDASLKLCDLLEALDPIRQHYWEYKRQLLTNGS